MTTAARVTITADQGVAQLRLNRPDKMNALDSAMFRALPGAADQLRQDRSIRAVVVAGEGKAFCAGLDMQSFQRMQRGESVNADAGFPFDRGRRFSGEEAVRIGFTTRVEADPLAAATALARQIASQSPEAVRAAKRLLNLSLHADPATVLQAESYEQERLVGSAGQVEAVMANMEKRLPRFQD